MTPVGRQMLVVGVVGLLVGFAGGFAAFHHPTALTEPPAPAVRQADSSLVLERAPDAKAKPAQVIPKGATVERVVQLEVQPNQPSAPRTEPEIAKSGISSNSGNQPETGPAVVATAPAGEQKPIRVDLTLLRMGDGTQRVVASSPDGRITGGIDVPVADAPTPGKIATWGVGVVRNFASSYAAAVTHDFGRLAVYTDAAPRQGLVPAHASLGLLWRF